MVGSPNSARFVYDGDGSAFGTAGPNGSANIETVFLDYFASQGLATEPTEFDGRSDYFGFINNGIPAGGLFTGAEGIKTAAQAAIFGGTAGEAFDPCYHQACDTIDNVTAGCSSRWRTPSPTPRRRSPRRHLRSTEPARPAPPARWTSEEGQQRAEVTGTARTRARASTFDGARAPSRRPPAETWRAPADQRT